MDVSKEIINNLAEHINRLFDHLTISNVPEHAPYRGFLSIDRPFSLNDEGYYIHYQGLKKSIISLENYGGKWSDQAINEKINDLLFDLAHSKSNRSTLDYFQIAKDWVQKFIVEFAEQKCFVPVAGLVVDTPQKIGDVTFLPLDEKSFSDAKFFKLFLEHFSPENDCIATTTVSAEWMKSAEVAREKIEKILNILRYIGSLVWWDRQIGHINLAGQELKRVSYTLVVDSQTGVITGEKGHTESTPVPCRVDNEFLEFARFYGLEHLQSLINRKALPIEEDYFAAIQWYGYATQELDPIVSFVKFYIAMESALKKENERAKNVLPNRIGVLIEPWDTRLQDKIETDIKALIDERNSVFHEGRTQESSPAHLAEMSNLISRRVLHQLGQRIGSENIQTKDDLIAWVETQQKMLST